MTKIDKLLYGGFAVVAIGVVVAMLVTVFSPPKPIVEETVETPTPPQIEPANSAPVVVEVEPVQQETEFGYYLDDEGNKVWLTAEDIAASDAIEAEFKRQEEEQKALDEAEKAWWESRQDWVERFPFEPTPHPEITFDPTVFDVRKLRAGEWPEEKKDKAYWDMKRQAEHHSLLKGFYNSWVPYTEEFEQLHDIVEEELGEAASTAVLAQTFRTLAKYHKAAQQDSDAIFRENVEVELPRPEPVNRTVEIDLGPNFHNLQPEKQNEMIAEITVAYREEMRARNTPQYEVRDVTWAEETEMIKECIVGALTNPEIGWEGIPKEQAIAIRERLINEIPAAGFLELPKVVFASSDKYIYELKAGDPLLIK